MLKTTTTTTNAAGIIASDFSVNAPWGDKKTRKKNAPRGVLRGRRGRNMKKFLLRSTLEGLWASSAFFWGGDSHARGCFQRILRYFPLSCFPAVDFCVFLFSWCWSGCNKHFYILHGTRGKEGIHASVLCMFVFFSRRFSFWSHFQETFWLLAWISVWFS